MNEDYVILNNIINPFSFGKSQVERWYDYYTLWSCCLFSLTLLLILIDQFKEFLPGWWIAFIFANTIVVGIMGTLIVTINADVKGTEIPQNRLEYAYSQLFFHTIPFVISVILLLMFPTILKPFKVWQVIVAFAVLAVIYLSVPTSNCKKIFLNKINQVYYSPNMFLLSVTYLGVIAFIIYVEKRIVDMNT